MALRKLGQYEEACQQLSLTRRSYPATPESLAAGLEEAEILQATSQWQPASQAFAQVLREAGRPETYDSPWVPLAQLQQRVLRAWDRFLQNKQFAQALGLAQSCWPIVPRVRAIEIQAMSQRAWAHDLLQSAGELPPSEADAARQQAYTQLRQAGASSLRWPA